MPTHGKHYYGYTISRIGEVRIMAQLMNKRVAVIGAGIAGLVAACRLSAEGAGVIVFEKDHSAGGRAKTTIKDGFHLNLGPHALYTACQTYKFLKDNYIAVSGAPPKLAGGMAIYRKKMHSLPISLSSTLFSGYLDLRDKLEWLSFFASLPKLDLPSLMSVSLSDWCAHNLKQERVRQTVEAFVRLSLYASCPQKVSAGQAFRQLLLAQQGVLYLDGGWQAMIDALLKKAETKACFRFGATIEAIEKQGNGVEILVDGTREQFDAVFLCVPPDAVNKLTAEALASAQLTPGRIACLDVCLKRLPYPKRNFALGIDEPLYLSVHSAAAKLAPEGGALIHVGFYLNDEGPVQNAEV